MIYYCRGCWEIIIGTYYKYECMYESIISMNVCCLYYNLSSSFYFSLVIGLHFNITDNNDTTIVVMIVCSHFLLLCPTKQIQCQRSKDSLASLYCIWKDIRFIFIYHFAEIFIQNQAYLTICTFITRLGLDVWRILWGCF